MRFDPPERKKLTLEMTIPIRWGDMDAMGHVNNTIYFRYMEIVRLEWLYRIGGTPDPHGIGPVIVNAFCNFIKQLEFPGDVLARHYVANPGAQQLRDLHHARAPRRAGRDPCERRGQDGVDRHRRAAVGAAAGETARARRMSPPGRPKGDQRRAQHEGAPVSARLAPRAAAAISSPAPGSRSSRRA